MRVGVIFDFDGVVVDSEVLHYRAYGEVLAEFGLSVDKATYGRVFIGQGIGAQWAHETLGVPLTPEEIIARKRPILERLLRAEVELMPGAADALERLAAEFPLALATNSRLSDVEIALDRFDLRGRFAHLVTREDYERGKPAPDAFLAALDALGLPAARCVVIEDSEKGVRAAHAAGISCVAVPHEFTRENDFTLATRVVDGLGAVDAALVRELTA